MSQQRGWAPLIPEKVRHLVRAVTRLQFAAVAAVVVAAAMAVALLPRGLSDAATTAAPVAAASPAPTPTTSPNDDGLTWTVPDGDSAYQGSDANGCFIYDGATVSAADAGTITQIWDALNDERGDAVNQDDINTLSPLLVTQSGTSMTVDASAGVDCSLENQTDAYIERTGYGSLGQFTGAVLDAELHPAPAGSRLQARQHAVLLAYDALPSWLRGAIGAITGAVVYVAVSVVTVSAMVALGAATTATGGLAAPVLAAFAGCVGGAISTAVTLAIAGASTTPLGIVASGVAGCLTGGLIAQIPAGTAGVWLGNAFRQSLGLGATPAAVVGESIVTDAAASSVELTPISTALQDAAAAFANPANP